LSIPASISEKRNAGYCLTDGPRVGSGTWRNEEFGAAEHRERCQQQRSNVDVLRNCFVRSVVSHARAQSEATDTRRVSASSTVLGERLLFTFGAFRRRAMCSPPPAGSMSAIAMLRQSRTCREQNDPQSSDCRTHIGHGCTAEAHCFRDDEQQMLSQLRIVRTTCE
jgi:hypothetical protein